LDAGYLDIRFRNAKILPAPVSERRLPNNMSLQPSQMKGMMMETDFSQAFSKMQENEVSRRHSRGFHPVMGYLTRIIDRIDENDEVYDKLKVWSKTDDGKDELRTLKESGVGAIFLGSENTEFTLDGADGALDGKVRKTGIFLKEDGTAGTIQHVDLAIKGRESELMSAAEKLDKVLEKMRSENSQRSRQNNNNDNARRRAQRAARQKKQLEDYQKRKELNQELTEKAIEHRKMLYGT